MHFAALIQTWGVSLALGTAHAPCAGAKSTSLHPHVDTVENGGLLFTDNSAGVTGTDCGYSLPIGDRTLWLFGDVFLQDPKSPLRPIVGAVSNCGLLVARGHGSGTL